MAASLKPEEFELMSSLGDVARHHGRTRANKLALSFEGRHTTYAQLDAHSNQVAAALLATTDVRLASRHCERSEAISS